MSRTTSSAIVREGRSATGESIHFEHQIGTFGGFTIPCRLERVGEFVVTFFDNSTVRTRRWQKQPAREQRDAGLSH